MKNELSYKQIILKLLSQTEWLPAYKLEKENTPYGYLGTSGSRRARELAKEGKLETKYENGYVFYRLKRNVLYVFSPKREVLQEKLI